MSSKSHIFLIAAILTEVCATTALARSESFTKLIPSLIAIVAYATSIWLMSFPLRTMPTGIVYAIWSGLGIVLITTVAWVWSKQSLDPPALLGLGLIMSGVIVINLFSKTIGH